MKKYDQIHETVVKDIFDIYNSIKDLSTEELGNIVAHHKNKQTISSIAKKSNDLICVFPVMSSKNISIDVQAMVAKAVERNCVELLQILFSAIPVSDADNAFDYLNQFHTNISKSAKMINLDDIIQVADSISVKGESSVVGTKPDYTTLSEVQKDTRNINYYLEDDVSDKSINESFSCTFNTSGNYDVKSDRRIIKEDADQVNNAIDKNGVNKDLHVDQDLARQADEIKQLKDNIEDIRKANHKNMTRLNDELNEKDRIINNLNSEKEFRNRDKNLADLRNKNSEFFDKQVLSSDYKKPNELVPTLMNINFKVKTTDGSFETINNAVVGVKAKLYPMSSDDVITHLVTKAKDSNVLTKLIKVSTREISFFKDFLFAIDKAKIDALSMSRKGSSNMMWKVLERRATKSRFNRLMARSNDASAITTLVISQNEVDFIKKEYHIDIADIRNAKIIMDEYNLLGFVIVDESLELAKFMWDTGEDLWETVSFGSLERESNDNTYKKVVNLMTKVM